MQLHNFCKQIRKDWKRSKVIWLFSRPIWRGESMKNFVPLGVCMIKISLVIIFFAGTLFANSKQEIAEVLRGVDEHINAKLEDAEVESYPFPHIVIEGIFPDDLYQKMMDLWPETSEFSPAIRSILPTNYGCIEQTTMTT